MDQQNKNNGIKMRIGIVSAIAAAIVIFVCIFSLYHLPERDPVETPVMAVDDNAVSSPAGDIEETNDMTQSTPEQVAAMIGDLEMQYQNAALNSEPYEAQQAGLRLALAYIKAGQESNAKELIDKMLEAYPYDKNFVDDCNKMIEEYHLSN